MLQDVPKILLFSSVSTFVPLAAGYATKVAANRNNIELPQVLQAQSSAMTATQLISVLMLDLAGISMGIKFQITGEENDLNNGVLGAAFATIAFLAWHLGCAKDGYNTLPYNESQPRLFSRSVAQLSL
jgi:hypothetical protein